jgi:hypothetical protein
MGQNARARYEELFTGATMGAKYVSVYRQVLLERADVSNLSSAHSG